LWTSRRLETLSLISISRKRCSLGIRMEYTPAAAPGCVSAGNLQFRLLDRTEAAGYKFLLPPSAFIPQSSEQGAHAVPAPLET
jgi:hypothetical protein